MQLTEQQIVFVVKNYFETKSFEIVQQRFEEKFLERSLRTRKTIWKNVRKFNNEETTINLNKNRSGRKNTARTQENINLVLKHLLEDPKKSARRNGLDLSKDTFQRLVKYELEWYPYKMRVRHELLQADYPRPLHFANWFMQRHERFIEKNIVIGNEAAFHMNGRVNSHNVRQYAARYHPPDFHNDLRMSRE